MTWSWEHRSPIAPGKPREKLWDITRVLYRCAGRSIARALRPIIYERAISKRLTRLPTPSLSSSWRARSASNRKRDTIQLFEVRFALQNHPMPEVSLPNLSARLSMRSTGTARFQLGCEITEAAKAWKSPGFFARICFPDVTLKVSMAYFRRVLAGICRSPENRISEVLNRSQ